MTSATQVIYPYKDNGTWVFDDLQRNLVREPFVAGTDKMIDRVVADIPDAAKGFRLTFSASPFTGHRYRLDWLREEGGGNWYRSEQMEMEGWLCPALLLYFPAAPKHLYVRPEPKQR
jgi:hypothetical protein